ncbi:flexible cuticle protein 12-like [Adelges cooleyi]|uniref:flexible cuticle protein 12-like n=1 Tax=Adelges cooleyi TaxID=133065 RepID=UPI00217F2D23|nr:flexible cuticle protein 12-like [Adelges cooleyi]
MFAVLAVCFVLVGSCLAAPSPSGATFIQNDQINDNAGQFALLYKTTDGITQSKQGALVVNDEGNGYVMEQKGTYSFISPEGVEVKMTYTAGKDGFKVQGYPLPEQPQAASA